MIKTQKQRLKDVLSAFENKNEKEFKFLLEIFAISSNVSLQPFGIDMTLIEYVLQTPNSSEFIKICLEFGNNFHKINSAGHYIVYYAIQSMCTENLEVLLEHFDDPSNDEYIKKLAQSMIQKCVLKNENNYLHVIIEKLTENNYEECCNMINILLRYNCSPNHLNADSKTPFEYLLDKISDKFDASKLIAIFLETKIEISDDYHQRALELNIGDKVEIRQNDVVSMQYLIDKINEGNEQEFINLLKNVDSTDVMSNIQDFMKLLIDMNFADGVREILNCARLNENIIKNGYSKNGEAAIIVDRVNAQKLPIDLNFDIHGLMPLFYAITLCRHEIVKIFLKFNDITLFNGTECRNVLHEICSLNKIENDQDFQKCFHVIIQDKRCDLSLINAFDTNRKTPLLYACENGHKEIQMELLRRGAYIGNENILKYLSETTLKEFLDECINPSADLNDPDCKIHINYKFLIPQKHSNEKSLETKALNQIASQPKFKNLLTHPIFTSFLELKWKRVNLPIYIGILLYFIIFVYLSVFILNFFNNEVLQVKKVHNNLTQNTSTPFELSPRFDDYEDPAIENEKVEEKSEEINVLKILFGRRKREATIDQTYTEKVKKHIKDYSTSYILCLAGAFILTLCELVQFFFTWKTYFLKLSNWVDCTLLCLAYIVLLNSFNGDAEFYQKLRAILFLVIAIQSFILIGMVSKLSLQLEIFKKVGRTFLKFIMLYFMLIFAFAMSFHTLYGREQSKSAEDDNSSTNKEDKNNDDDDENPFPNIFFSLITVTRMMLSDFDAIKLKPGDQFNAVIFLSFIVLITIILFNLLNALAINDTQQIMKSAEIVDIRKRIKMIKSCEKFLSFLNIDFFNIYSNLIYDGKIILKINKDNYVRIRNHCGKPYGTLKYSAIPTGIEMATKSHEKLQKYSKIELPQLIPWQKLHTSLLNCDFINPKLTMSTENITKIINHVKDLVEKENHSN